MQVKVSPLNWNPITNEFEESGNVGIVGLSQGKMRLRVSFMPMNEAQYALVADMLPRSDVRIVDGNAEPLLKIEREVHPSLPPEVHMLGEPLWLDIEIGPRQLSVAESPETASPHAADPMISGTANPAKKSNSV